MTIPTHRLHTPSAFIETIHHELRTPLTTILGSVELLQYHGHKWSEPKQLKHLKRIHSAAIEMKQMLDSNSFSAKLNQFAAQTEQLVPIASSSRSGHEPYVC